MTYVRNFAGGVKASGLAKHAAERAGLRGTQQTTR